MPDITVDPSQVHSITVDPSDVQSADPKFTAEATAKAPVGGFHGFLNSVGEYLSTVGKGAVNLVKGPADMLRSAMFDDKTGMDSNAAQMVKGTAERNLQSLHEAEDAWKQGRYNAAALHAFNYLAPFGSSMDEMLNDAEQRHLARALGNATVLGVSLAAPSSPYVRAALGKLTDVKVTPTVTNPNALDQAATKFGQDHAIPDSAAGVTGNTFVQGAQKFVDSTPLGAVVAKRAQADQAAAMTRVGGELADQVHPTAVAPAQAGRDVTSSLENTIAGHNAEANRQYSTLREIEADPANTRNVQVGTKQIPWVDEKTGQTIPDKFRTVPDMQDVQLPVDLRAVKTQLRDTYQQLLRQLPITQVRGSTGMKALENIMNGPDAAPATQVDMDLGSIKAAARGADLPELKTLSQGLAAKAVSALHDAVSEAVGRAERTVPGSAPASAPAAPESPVATPAATPEVAPFAGGAATRIPIPNSDRAYNAEYRILDRSDVQASHNAQTFNPNPQYGLTNERNYNNTVNQAKVVENSTPQRFDPAQVVNDNADATAGPPVTDEQGNALAGNGRKMMIDRAYDADPGSGFGLKDRLVDRAAQFGATPEEVRAMREPMLVRVVPDAELARPGFTKTDAIRDFNVPGTAALTPAEQAIADARRVSQPTLDHIAERMEAKGPDATLAQVLEGRDGVEILNKLMADGAIARGDLAGLTTENALTAAGRARISQAMLGRYFRDPEQLDNIALSVKSKMERLAAPLASLEREGDYSLTPHVRSAMELLEAQRAHGSATVDDYLNQSSMFARERYSPEAQELARKLQTANPNDLVAAVRHYAAEAKYAGAYQGPGMFDDPLNRLPEPVTPRAAFNDAFGTKLPANGEAPAPEPPPVPKPSAAFADAFKPAPAAPPTPTAPPLGAKVGKFAGPEARAALDAGRAATAQKYDVASVLKSLPKSGDEGRQVFEQAFWQKDAGIEQLRRVAAAAPAEIPKLARAWIDDAVHTATQEGGFTRGAKLQRDWQNLGPETKALLFHPRMVADLDNFFRLAARQAANPNPSGSGVYTLSVAHAGWAIMHPVTGVPVVLAEGAVSRLMHSPAGIKALTDGLTVNVANKAAASLAAARILELAGQAVKTPQARLAAQAPRPQSGQRELLASR